MSSGARPERWFGAGEDGLRRLFEVWGEEEPKNVARIPLHRAATRPIGQMIDSSHIEQVLAQPVRPRRTVDPRGLLASQHGVTYAGVRYYFREARYRRTGWTWADQWSRINREIVVWGPAPDGPQLLSGHHRTTAALLRGELVEVVWLDPRQPTPRGGTRITPSLWVGAALDTATGVTSAHAATQAVVSDRTAIVESVGEARRVLDGLAVDPQWADSLVAFGTTGRLM